MTVIEKTLTTEQDIATVFDKLFETNDAIFNEHMKILEWNIGEWKMKKKIKQRKQEMYIQIDALPDEVKQYTIENEKKLRLEIKNKLIIDEQTQKKIKSKFKLLNLNKFLRTVVNDLHIVNIKNTVELFQNNANHTTVRITIKIQFNIPKTKMMNDFINKLAEDLMNSAANQLA